LLTVNSIDQNLIVSRIFSNS